MVNNYNNSTFSSIFGLNDRVKIKGTNIIATVRGLCFKVRRPIQVQLCYYDENKCLNEVWLDDDEVEISGEENTNN